MSHAILRCILCNGTGWIQRDGERTSERCLRHVFEAIPAHTATIRLRTKAGQVVGEITCDWPSSVTCSAG